MLAFIACFVGVMSLLVIAELLWRAKILLGEYQRKFVHIAAGTFFASWPWLLSWRQIQVMGLLMLTVLAANRFDEILHYSAGLRASSLGGFCLALAVIAAAMITTNKIFYAVAILNISLSDGFAAVIGTSYGKRYVYHIFGHKKTVVGTMAFWLSSLFIVGVGLLFVPASLTFAHYALLLVLLPPFLATVENITPLGFDNLTIPLAVLLVLELASL